MYVQIINVIYISTDSTKEYGTKIGQLAVPTSKFAKLNGIIIPSMHGVTQSSKCQIISHPH